jgi:uncharacterized YccA/Bax inhibitor family protein
MRSANPSLRAKSFDRVPPATDGRVMTINGTVHRTALLLIILMAAALWTWRIFFNNVPEEGPVEDVIGQGLQTMYPWLIGGGVGGFILALVTIFNKRLAPYTSPFYAACEGLFLGGISAVIEPAYPGIALQAVGLTLGTMFALLMAYRSGLIRVTQNFRLGVIAATGGIFMLYLVNFIMRLFGTSIPFIHESGWVGIGFSLFVVVIASLNLVLDFDYIERAAKKGAPKHMEWYGAFGLLVTLVWLYIEILHLLMKLRDR